MKYFSLLFFILSVNVTFSQSKGQPLFSGSYIAIAKGAKFTNSRSVSLEIYSAGATQMKISNRPDFNGANWAPYKTFIQNWNVGHADGIHEIFIMFKRTTSTLNKTSDVYSSTIELDTTPPENPYVKIDVPSGFVNSKDKLLVDLNVSAVDAKYMMVSNHRSFYGHKWTTYRDVFPDWQLEEGDDGPRYVFVKFRDKAGNVSPIVSDMISLDTRRPIDADIKISEGARYTIRQDRKVQLTLFARPVDSMMISNNQEFKDAIWEKFLKQKEWALSENDGEKTVYVKYKNKANNESEVVFDEIILDTTPPTEGNLTIDNGSKTTNHVNKEVTLSISANKAKWMLISNHPSFSGARWMRYRTTVASWKLPGEDDGKRIIYIKFKDDAGNISTIYKGEIVLERGIRH